MTAKRLKYLIKCMIVKKKNYTVGETASILKQIDKNQNKMLQGYTRKELTRLQ